MFQAILDSAGDAILGVDETGKVASVNHATEGLFGYSSDEMIDKNVASLLASADPSAVMHPFATQASGVPEYCTGSHYETTAVRKDGSCFDAELTVSRIDHLPLFIVVIRDVSLRKELETRILEIASDEQQRIGQELHDGTQQELTGLSLIAGTIEDFFAQKMRAVDGDLNLSRNELSWCCLASSKLVQGLKDANQHVQTLSHGIMPVQIDPEGLQSALSELANSTTVVGKVTCQFTHRGSSVVEDNAAATHLYRIAQEAVNNAQRHGKATNIHVSLSDSKHHMELEVSDDGIGIAASTLQQSGQLNDGMGLQIMRYRANVIGAKLAFSVGNNHETIVTCKIAKHRNAA
ncbi:PAS domain-containing sensor histidine kinase [Rhodopirellula baltica]|uniref:histidine kinase n=1 Tax=Rhodopirellula baltica WH47 TaxID=991778 RepID=F2B146_RHOBT|nr:PAS domain S-box protein [Rhodopirellula baltica]EGF24398.1 multi-sensor signal transduction histidine kinase [Rhodopirellula baltica WH47]